MICVVPASAEHQKDPEKWTIERSPSVISNHQSLALAEPYTIGQHDVIQLTLLLSRNARFLIYLLNAMQESKTCHRVFRRREKKCGFYREKRLVDPISHSLAKKAWSLQINSKDDARCPGIER